MNCKVGRTIMSSKFCNSRFLTTDQLVHPTVINAYATALCAPVPPELVFPLNSAQISSGLAKPTYTATNSSVAGTGTLFLPKPTSFTGDAVMVKLRISDFVFGMFLWLGWTIC